MNQALGRCLFDKVRLSVIRWKFNLSVQGIFRTAPVIRGKNPFVVLSMVQHKDIGSYLVAIKTFALQLQPKQIVIICDPSITKEDEAVLTRHLPHAILQRSSIYAHDQLPVGGCWERLHALTVYAANDYVVQLDADTVTLSPLPEVVSAIKHRYGFVLNGYLPIDQDDEPATSIVPIDQASSYANRWSPKHIQAFAEQQMKYAGLGQPYYVRGCAGFTGFPPDPNLREKLIEFSRKMERLLGSRWYEWGTEQVASNYLVANAIGTHLLPQPKYSAPGGVLEEHSFVHFIGACRFINGDYEKAVRQAIRMITRPTGIAA